MLCTSTELADSVDLRFFDRVGAISCNLALLCDLLITRLCSFCMIGCTVANRN